MDHFRNTEEESRLNQARASSSTFRDSRLDIRAIVA